MLVRTAGFAAIMVLGIAVAACSRSDDTCFGSMDQITQTGNRLNATGTFANGQPVMHIEKGTTVIEAAGNASDGNWTFDITGVAKGVYTATWFMSCDDGSYVQMTNNVPVVTIQ